MRHGTIALATLEKTFRYILGSMSLRSSVIHIEHLTKKFGRDTAVSNISFSVDPGEVVGFVGPNGAGKTTTISMLMGFLHATEGTIKLFGDPVTTQNAHTFHQRIGFAAGDMAMLDNLTGQQYLAHMGHLTRYIPARQAELITLFSPVLHKKLKTLSRGNKQKIALIAALQHQPKLLILDEPTSGLDPLMQETFMRLLSEVAADGTTVFMSSHILSEVTDVCRRVMFMKNGTIILDKPVKVIEQQAGKEVRIQASKETLLALMRSKPKGLGKPTQNDDGQVVCLYKGATPRLLQWLGSHKITDVQIRDRDFDSIFHSMYEDNEEPS